MTSTTLLTILFVAIGVANQQVNAAAFAQERLTFNNCGEFD